MSDSYQQQLGQRLRAIRQQQDLTLQDVENASDGKWKAVVVGAYERADRAISAAKLAGLARFYGVPVAEFLPEPAPRDTKRVGPGTHRTIILDLTRLTRTSLHPALRPISRLATTIQRQRGDYNGRVLSLRQDDLRSLAVVYGLSSEQLAERLAREGVLLDHP